MKKLIVTFGAAALVLLGMAVAKFATHDGAKVKQAQGVFLFVDSEPTDEYEYLGTVKLTMSFSGGQYTDVRDKLLKRIKSDYPQANGAIFRFSSGQADQADAIKFKD